jgi:hypothetical protein
MPNTLVCNVSIIQLVVGCVAKPFGHPTVPLYPQRQTPCLQSPITRIVRAIGAATH